MGNTTRRTSRFEICLCPLCATHFFNSATRRIYRTDPLQDSMDKCDLCRTRWGYDFSICTYKGRV